MSDVPTALVIGAGPAGLMAADVLSAADVAVTLHEHMPSAGRKFLMAGRGGLNLTHSEPLERFVTRYGTAADRIAPMLDAFPPSALIAWAEALGQPTFTGSSGRVFPRALKASPLLRALLARLAARGVTLRTRSRWTGWNENGALTFVGADGAAHHDRPDVTVLALGGGSWPKLGATGAWTGVLTGHGVTVHPLRPANCGFNVAWTDVFQERFAGAPLKSCAMTFAGETTRGEAMISASGLEGGGVYALSAALRDAIDANGAATVQIDLRPDVSVAALAQALDRPRGKHSVTEFLRKSARLAPVAIGMLREAHGKTLAADAMGLARQIKTAPITLTAAQSLDRAISSAGGVAFTAVDDDLMLRAAPGVYVAGEMLDWEAPTGGYLLQATFASAVWAAKAALRRVIPASR